MQMLGYGDTPTAGPSVLLIADEGSVSDLAFAIRDAGGTPTPPIAWATVSRELAAHDEGVPIIADATAIAGEALSTGLQVLADIAARRGPAILVRLARDQIDTVATTLIDTSAVLLCDATPREEAIALATVLAARSGTALHHDASDGERQLRKLNDDVARIAETLARLSKSATSAGDARQPYERSAPIAPAPPAEGAAPVRARDVREAIRARRLRDQFLGEGLFEDPAWDMLLDLYAAELERGQVSVSSLCIAAHVAPTTALRWIGKMTDRGLLVRQPDPFDRRRAFMALSHVASRGMASYAAALQQAGLHFA